MSRGRGSGSARAETTTSWSALATTTRSMGSVSSAVRRSTVRALGDPHDPGERAVAAGRVADEAHLVTDDDALAAQLAGPHRERRASASGRSPTSTV